MAFLNGNATVQSTVQAFIGDGTTVRRRGQRPAPCRRRQRRRQLRRRRRLGRRRRRRPRVSANASSNVTTRAFIGDGVTLGTVAAPVNGDVTVTAIGRGEADAIGQGRSAVALIRIGLPQASAVVDPTVDAHVGTSAAATRTTVVVATGTITVLAQLIEGRARGRRRPACSSVSATGDTLTFSYPGIGEGAQVQYSGRPPAGSTAGRTYTVLDARHEPDPARFAVRLPRQHRPGARDDHVRRAARLQRRRLRLLRRRAGGRRWSCGTAQASASTNGCNVDPARAGAQRYFVRVIDTRRSSSRTRTPQRSPPATRRSRPRPGHRPSAGDPTPLTFVDGGHRRRHARSIYRAPDQRRRGVLRLSGQRHARRRGRRRPGHHGAGGRPRRSGRQRLRRADRGPPLNTGDAVRYASSSPSFGLATATTYYVIKSADGYTIRLAATFCHAVGAAGDAAMRRGGGHARST